MTTTTTTTIETPIDLIARLRAKGWGPARILAAAGHPGYGTAFARRAIARIEAAAAAGIALSWHAAIYGGREWHAARAAAAERGVAL